MGSTRLTSDEPSGAKSRDNKARGSRKWGQDDAGGDCTYGREQVKALVGSTRLTSDEHNGAKSGDNKGRGGRKWGQDDTGGNCTYEREQVRALIGSMRLTSDEANDATSADAKGAKSGDANGGSGRKYTDDKRDEHYVEILSILDAR